THQNFQAVMRKAKEMVGEPYFYFHCGASSASLRSWGRLDYFTRVFAGPSDGFKRLPFFNRQFNDTKDIEVIVPPAYDKSVGKIRTLLEIRHHSDIDVHQDYMGDPFSRGLISSIPTLWGLPPATVKQPLNPYDPEVLFIKEPEFSAFNLDPRIEDDHLSVNDPGKGQRIRVGRKVLLLSEPVNGRYVFLGRYLDISAAGQRIAGETWEALLITETVQADNRILLRAGEVFKAPSLILDITYDKSSLGQRISHFLRAHRNQGDSATGLIETINQLRETNESRNKAYHRLEKANLELLEARNRLNDYARTLEQKVDERTAELKRAQERLLIFNRDLEAKVTAQVEELSRYQELRRYLSPSLTEKILSSGDRLGAEPQRKMMTVLFSDIRNFSSFTERLEPEELFQLLDKYLSEMTKLIHQYEGTLNKIVGDGMLVFFGDPIPMEDHAERAVMMAIEMQKKVTDLKHEWLQYGHELGIGIGINTGYMTIGNIGSDIHKDYTVIGNQVNIAARLETLAKAGQILISRRTYTRVKELVEVERMGEVKVKGIQNLVEAYVVKVF
ncbi:MAG: adenylate/guanylate cyclase domain-containing protein, partial [Proteobacteria bacterium]|nr:adenylate/guanylate cyclase domain-containing protein [Pseudomonadota bacterium]